MPLLTINVVHETFASQSLIIIIKLCDLHQKFKIGCVEPPHNVPNGEKSEMDH
jgi:hypothetical protein